MIRLHYYPGNASMTPHIVLRELGIPFELQLVDRSRMTHRSPDYLKLNPNGLIPTLQDADLVLYETAAIVLHLVDTHPDVPLAPALATPARAEFYKWLMWLGCSVQPLMTHYFYSDRMVAPSNETAAAQVRDAAEQQIAVLMDRLEDHFARHGQDWMLGERYSALDAYAFMLCRWTRMMKRPARTLPQLGAFLQRMLSRPAVAQTLAAEQLGKPFV
jgi:glutathione S-transferase